MRKRVFLSSSRRETASEKPQSQERWLLVCKYQQLRKLDFQPIFHASWSETPLLRPLASRP
uniref:Uncharacterized protein n=1 Tax=Nelumbo nucifera TaxID=4432 RepID=A0A822YLP2_NELNU|nr:TPA_asm: hypothetical protein HUJ06_010766 [Nelumbo nucifera]